MLGLGTAGMSCKVTGSAVRMVGFKANSCDQRSAQMQLMALVLSAMLLSLQ